MASVVTPANLGPEFDIGVLTPNKVRVRVVSYVVAADIGDVAPAGAQIGIDPATGGQFYVDGAGIWQVIPAAYLYGLVKLEGETSDVNLVTSPNVNVPLPSDGDTLAAARTTALTGNTGEHDINGMSMGDTGWRDVSADLINGWSGSLWIRRIGNTVHMANLPDAISGASATNSFAYELDLGFRSTYYTTTTAINDGSSPYLVPFRVGTFVESRGLLLSEYLYLRFGSVWVTDDPWPTVLPGVAFTNPFVVGVANPTPPDPAAAPPADYDIFTPIAPVSFGTLASYGAATPDSAFVSGGASLMNGDVASSSYFFSGAGTHNGISTAPATAQMGLDIIAAYNDMLGRSSDGSLTPTLSGTTVTPGVWTSVGAVVTTANTSFTINAQGNPNAVFILQINGDLSLGAGFTINLVNGAEASNVFWQVNGAVGMGGGAVHQGSIVASTAITVGLGVVVNGRLITKSGAVSMSATSVYSQGDAP